MPTRFCLFALALLLGALPLAPAVAAGSIDRRGVDHLDPGFRPVRLSAAALQGQDRHRGEGGRAGHRPGARHRAARRRRRGVRPRQGRRRRNSSPRALA